MTINSKSTKTEILAAYKEIEKQNKSLEAEVRKGGLTSKTTNQVIVEKKEVVTVKNYNNDISATIKSLEQIQNNFGSAVSNLSERLISESTKLTTIRNAIAQEKSQLEQLHKLTDIEDTTIDTLIQQYQANVKRFTEQLNQKQEESQQEIETLLEAWTKEQETHNRLVKTRDDEYRKTQQRQQLEYEYNLNLERNLNQEEYEQEQKIKQEELKLTRTTIEKQWQEREAAIAKQEQDYSEAQIKVSAFEEQLKAKIKQGKEEGTGIGNYQTKIKTELRNREIIGETQNYQLRIEDLQQIIQQQESRINKLSQQLDTSLQQVQNLAVKAIEGTSNRNSFEAMKAIALEQAKTQIKNK
ncbi:hypothetical protein NIES4102_22470 [Chondrocystis sp. NIES-4102]|nr:hypothetical protein NIES4102_22470 [Chondrocystis sp. NIES-4102]